MASWRSLEMNLGTYLSGAKTGFLVGDAFGSYDIDVGPQSPRIEE